MNVDEVAHLVIEQHLKDAYLHYFCLLKAFCVRVRIADFVELLSRCVFSRMKIWQLFANRGCLEPNFLLLLVVIYDYFMKANVSLSKVFVV